MTFKSRPKRGHRSRPSKSLDYPTKAVKIESLRARIVNYIAASDFEDLILQAAILRQEDKNSRAAFMLENAAHTVRKHAKYAYLNTRIK